MLTAIVAAGWDGQGGYIIGQGDKLPWRLPKELRLFRSQTMGKTLIMGRKTWETLPQPLDGREIIVFSSKDIPGVTTIGAPEQAPDEAYVCGGAQTYDAFMPFIDCILFTEVFNFYDDGVKFPLSKDQLNRMFRIQESSKIVKENGTSWKRFVYKKK